MSVASHATLSQPLFETYPDEAPCLDDHLLTDPSDEDSRWWAMQAGYGDEDVPDEIELNTMRAIEYGNRYLDPSN